MSYEESFEASVKYFDGDELAAKVFLDKYCLRDNEGKVLEKTPEDMHRRLASEFARIESKKFKNPFSEKKIFNLFSRFRYIIPQGSPMFGIGNNYQIVSLSNCYVTPSPKDSYGGIFLVDQQLAQIAKRRGGVGIDISGLRPKNTPVKNAARTSGGIASWMERYSNTTREVGQGGRRGALMLTLDVSHPDIEDFITIKNDPMKVTGANISVKLTDEFLTAVKNNSDFRLRFPLSAPPSDKDIIIKAKDLWKKIIYCAWNRAEPGLLFWDRIIKYNSVDCYESHGFKTISTNPCSELPLSFLDSCRLLVLNLFSYVENPFTKDSYFNFDLFEEHSGIAQRLMDDMIDLELEKIDQIINKIENDPEEEIVKSVEMDLWKQIRQQCYKGRRTGTGITGTGDMLAALGIGYGTEKSILLVEKVHKILCLASFRCSMEMAKELGAFPVWDWDTEKDSEFLNVIKLADEKLYNDIKKHGRRNIANLTIAPTGSVAIEAQTTSGIEPLFMLLPYTRRKKINPSDKNSTVDFVDHLGDKWQEFEVYHPKVKMWMDITGETDLTKSPWYGYCAEDINWVQSVKMQAVAQNWIDHAISKTVNLPESATEDQVAKIYEAAWEHGCKGMTVYRKNCRTGVLIEKASKKEGKCFTQHDAVKRPEDLKAEAHSSQIKGQDYYVVIGFMEDKPYEIFAGKTPEGLKKISGKGMLVKVKRGQYVFKQDGESFNLSGIPEHEEGDALCRMISTSLRHGVALDFVVHQIEKTKGDMFSLGKILARTLKKYIPDGTMVKGDACPTCFSSSMERNDGCIICKSCGWTKC